MSNELLNFQRTMIWCTISLTAKLIVLKNMSTIEKKIFRSEEDKGRALMFNKEHGLAQVSCPLKSTLCILVDPANASYACAKEALVFTQPQFYNSIRLMDAPEELFRGICCL